MAGAAKGGGKGGGKGQPNMMVSSEGQAMMEGRRNKDMKLPKKMIMVDVVELMRDPRAGMDEPK